MATEADNRIVWIHGLRGLASWIIVLSHFRLCFWEWSVNGSTDEKIYFIQWPFVRLVCAGRPAVRVLLVLSGTVLSYSTVRHIHEDRPNAALVSVLRGMQTRYWRLMIPVMCISFVSVTLLWINAYQATLAAPGYLSQAVTRSEPGGLAADIWCCIWGSLVDVWIRGWQPAHSSLWCMKAILLGAYFLYVCWLLHGGQRGPPYIHWVVSAGLLISREAQNFLIADCAGTILGGIVAYHIVAKSKMHEAWAFGCLILGLFLASFPIGQPNASWCHWMYTVASKVMQLDRFSRHNEATCAFWYNIGAFFIVISITQLPLIQQWLSARWLQATGTISFALFLVHPIIFWTVGAATYSFVRGNLNGDPTFTRPISAAAMLATSLPASWFASVYWHRYIETPSFKVVRKFLTDQKEAWVL